MSKWLELIVIVEGKTEKNFVEQILVPHFCQYQIQVRAVLATKKGQSGGDIKFIRILRDLKKYLKQREHTHLTLLVDYYGIDRNWPGLVASKDKTTPFEKAMVVNSEIMKEIKEQFGDYIALQRFTPYISMHEFEALLFSDTTILAETLKVKQTILDKVIQECGEPENINDNPDTTPAKRLAKFSSRFSKTTTGVALVQNIGLATIRKKCPVFNAWISTLESLNKQEKDG